MRRLVIVFNILVLTAAFSGFTFAKDIKKNEKSFLFVHEAVGAHSPNNTHLVMPARRSIWSEAALDNAQGYVGAAKWVGFWDEFLKAGPPKASLTWTEGEVQKEMDLIITGARKEGRNIVYTTTGLKERLPNKGLQSKSLLEEYCYNTSRISASNEIACSNVTPTFILIVKPNCGGYRATKYRC